MSHSHQLPVHAAWRANSYRKPRSTYPPAKSKSLLRRRMPYRATYLLVSAILIFFFWRLHRDPSSPPPPPRDTGGKGRTPSSEHNAILANLPDDDDEDLPCRNLPGAEDVLVIMRTGSTELQDKLPIHLSTTLRCYPNYMIFSDYAETYHGEEILDALEYVDPEVQTTHADFELWRRLRRAGGRDNALNPSERSGPISRPQGATGKPSNPGWKLDKWKFLPMLNRTLHEWPDMKWYVFVETDTYIMWQNLLSYLRALPAEKPVYIGGQIWIGDIVFAHGGTGFAVSRPALQGQVKHFVENQKVWEDFTNWHWAGDCVLGKAMKDSGAPLTHAWPIWQADDIGDMNYARNDNGMRLWCMPTVSYHHLSPSVVAEMWQWEQEWIARTADPSAILRHKDVYKSYVLPRVQADRMDWDNHANEDQGPVESLAECREVCEALKACVQFAVSADMRCLTTSRPNLGELSRGVDSGWIYERMKKVYDDASWCVGGNGWIMP